MTAVSLFAAPEELRNDIFDVLRIYLGGVTLMPDAPGGEIALYFAEETQSGARVITVRDDQGRAETRTERVTGDAIIDKRLRRRQAKLCVYGLMKARFGYAPPWGSLTGIRPTRLVYARMAEGLPPQEAAARVAELFDVSADKTRVLREVVEAQSALPAPAAEEIDLYVGIPFCVTRCAYCSFLSGEVGKGELLRPYVDALLEEIALTKALIRARGLRPRAFYMGGGTPTSLPADMLGEVLLACGEWLSLCRENTVEAGRPDTIDREKLAVIKRAGAERISVNPQTMHDETLKRIGRAHTRAQTEAAYALARETGFAHINMDLIAGLPGENLAMFCQTLDWVRSLAPDSLTVHTLSIKRASLLHLWEAQLPEGDMVADMVRAGAEAAHGMGLRAYYLYRQKNMAGNLENVGYARPDGACLYNVDMMEDTANVLALGAGGTSKRIFPRQGRIERVFNVSDIREYIARRVEMAERKRALWEEKE